MNRALLLRLMEFELAQKMAKLPQVIKTDFSLDDEEDKKEKMLNRILQQKSASKFKYASLAEDDGHFVSYFLLKGDVVNGRDWGVTGESIPKNIHTFKGMPFTITAEEFIEGSPYGDVWDHPNIMDLVRFGLAEPGSFDPNNITLIKKFQSKFRVGIIEDVIKKDDEWLAVIRKDEPFIHRQFPPFCSPAIFKHQEDEPEGEIEHWEGIHLAGLQDRPAYGDIALYKGSCTGALGTCKSQFRQGSLPTKCPVMDMKSKLAVESIKLAALLSQTNMETMRQNVFKKEIDCSDPRSPQISTKCKTKNAVKKTY